MNIKILLSTFCIVSSISASAQSDLAFAITGDGNKDFLWMNIRQVDLSTGKVTKSIFQRNSTNYSLTNSDTKKTVDQRNISNGDSYSSHDYPTATFVAASAYDNRSGRLYFMPMKMAELRWMETDVKNQSPKFFTINSKTLEFSTPGESSQITRMVIGADGNGYALTNDGNHLIKFSTGKNPYSPTLVILWMQKEIKVYPYIINVQVGAGI